MQIIIRFPWDAEKGDEMSPDEFTRKHPGLVECYLARAVRLARAGDTVLIMVDRPKPNGDGVLVSQSMIHLYNHGHYRGPDHAAQPRFTVGALLADGEITYHS